MFENGGERQPDQDAKGNDRGGDQECGVNRLVGGLSEKLRQRDRGQRKGEKSAENDSYDGGQCLGHVYLCANFTRSLVCVECECV